MKIKITQTIEIDPEKWAARAACGYAAALIAELGKEGK